MCSISMVPNKSIGGPYKEWLYAIPLLHQLQYKDGIAHDSAPFDPKEPDWGTSGLDSSQLAQFKDFIKNEKYVHTCCY